MGYPHRYGRNLIYERHRKQIPKPWLTVPIFTTILYRTNTTILSQSPSPWPNLKRHIFKLDSATLLGYLPMLMTSNAARSRECSAPASLRLDSLFLPSHQNYTSLSSPKCWFPRIDFLVIVPMIVNTGEWPTAESSWGGKVPGWVSRAPLPSPHVKQGETSFLKDR